MDGQFQSPLRRFFYLDAIAEAETEREAAVSVALEAILLFGQDGSYLDLAATNAMMFQSPLRRFFYLDVEASIVYPDGLIYVSVALEAILLFGRRGSSSVARAARTGFSRP